MEAFVASLKSGDIPAVVSFLDSEPELKFITDEYKRNPLSIAVVHGHWELALILSRQYRISPHSLDANGENIYHLYLRGVLANPPKSQDFEVVRQENIAAWEKDQIMDLKKIEEMKDANPQNRPSIHMLVKKPALLELEFFADLLLFFPKYVISKHHVVLDRKNAQGLTPTDLAIELGIEKLAQYYDNETDIYQSRRRLLQGLNENLIREVGTYL